MTAGRFRGSRPYYFMPRPQLVNCFIWRCRAFENLPRMRWRLSWLTVLGRLRQRSINWSATTPRNIRRSNMLSRRDQIKIISSHTCAAIQPLAIVLVPCSTLGKFNSIRSDAHSPCGEYVRVHRPLANRDGEQDCMILRVPATDERTYS